MNLYVFLVALQQRIATNSETTNRDIIDIKCIFLDRIRLISLEFKEGDMVESVAFRMLCILEYYNNNY